ncbi:UDP-glycosyltransferase 86A2 [Arabidopsis lyrata subsp. lyrata]|uniref:UDP-glycosyltransferase 86A2 n=1 Tax=Arabidopsis lyrata subsp. lyrata TaxID=81972 RepID=UPI000A29BCEF|nr:UDP-glycosyltransferase 86A2 [Arabidopsis lyrata subsp. lyrata]|eukprot:XP_020883799.1 UDP-glycosyltransferase 86A2 [Arabidopsis lyrata subsp. lyrata]
MADVKKPKKNHHGHHHLHALLIPYPFQGHVNPFVHLAIKLASQGITVTFVNTHYIHHQITNGSDGDIFAGVRSESGLDIRYATVSDGLPVGFDRSLNHDTYQSSLLHVFYAHVEELVASLVGGDGGVNVMIADTFFVWPSVVARKFGLVCVSFWTEAALVFSLYYHMDLLRIHGHFGAQETRRDLIDYIPGVAAINPKDTASYLQETDTSSVVHQIIFKAFEDVKKVDFVLCNTIQQFEDKTIKALNTKIPFYAIGPIIPFNNQTGSSSSSVTTSLWSESDCTQWLNTKPKSSVLYVSFGSYAHVTKKDLVEIAHGILLSKVNFVWVVRPDIVSSDETNPLPEGFETEAGDRGIVIPWCCQMTVLSHESVGGFLTHCGWNSILETIWCEVPVLCFPLLTDQVTNRKLVVDDWEIGINLCEDKSDFGRDEVGRNINRLMCGVSKGKIGRVKMSLEGAVINSGSSEMNLGLFIDGLLSKVGLSNGKA